MPYKVVSAGNFEIISIQALPDQIWSAKDTFPKSTPEELAVAQTRDPQFFGESADQVKVSQHICVVRTGGKTILVDTGIPVDVPDAKLAAGMGEAKISPHEIEIVILTHRDLDHVGGNLTQGKPTFPNARYVIGRSEYEAFKVDPIRGENFPRFITPLEDQGKLDVVDDDAEVAPNVRLWLTPGHRSAATSVRLGNHALLLADVWHSPMQVTQTTWSAKFDTDPDLAASTRLGIVERAMRENLIVAVPHTPFFGLGRVISRKGLRSWQPMP